MTNHTVFRVLSCLLLVSTFTVGLSVGQSAPTATPTDNSTNASTGNATNQTMTQRPTVNPYGQGYLNKTGKYNSNNSTLGVYNNSTGMQKGGGFIYNSILDGFLTILSYFVKGLFWLIDAFLGLAVKMITFTPAPHWGSGWYQNPSNTIWPEKYHDWKSNAQPWTFFICIMATGIYLALGQRGFGILPARYERQGSKHLILAWVMAFWGWQLVGFWLNISNALGHGITADLTQTSIASNGLKGVLLIGLFFVAIWNIWIFLVIISLVSLRFIGLTALSPWIPFFFALKALPIRGLGMVGDGLTKLWFMLSLVTLPVSIALSVGFSPMTTDIFKTYGIGGLQLIAMQLGTAVACLVMPYVMYQKGGQALASVGVVGSAPTAEGMRQSYQNQRERAAEVKESTRQTVNGARDTHRGLRGADPVGDGGTGYATGQAGRQTFQTYTQPINQRIQNIRGRSSIDPETGGEIQHGLERHFPENDELEQLRQDRLNDIRNRLQDES